MNDLQVFNYGEQEVRTVLIEGNPWWVLADVCKVLELREPHRVAARLDDDERTQMTVVDSMGRKQKMWHINESGLYSVILRSDKTEAKTFKRWITHEVLPAIRRTGGYAVPTETMPEPSVETGLQKVGLIIRVAEHKAVPQSEQLRLLDLAIRDLTGTGINFTLAENNSSLPIMELPEVTGVLKKGKTKRGKGYIVEYLTLSQIADRAMCSPTEFNEFANANGIKENSLYGEWVRVQSSQGDAREFLYNSTFVLDEYRKEVR